MNRAHRAALSAAALIGCAAAAVLTPARSDAQWTAGQYASAQLTAATLPAATFDGCSNSAGDITVSWHYTSTAVPGLSAATMQWSASNGVLQVLTNVITPGQVTSTGPDGTGHYQTTIAAGLLGNIVSLNSFTIQSQTFFGNWTAVSTNHAEGASIGAAGLGSFTCTVP
jgi:hypothetical protein